MMLNLDEDMADLTPGYTVMRFDEISSGISDEKSKSIMNIKMKE